MKRNGLLVVFLFLLLAGCTMVSARERSPMGEGTVAPAATPAPTAAQEGDEAQRLVQRAVADLQARLGASSGDVIVQDVLPTAFSDASLGVPEPGVNYAQVVTQGYVIHLAVGDKVYEYRGSGERVVWVPGELDPGAVGPQMPPLSTEDAYQRVDIAGTGLSIEVPTGWFRLDPEWIWTPEPGSALRLGVKWMDLESPLEPEAAMLPQQAQILFSEEVALGWAQGRRFLVEVYAPAAQGREGQSSVAAVEMHVLAVVHSDGLRRALDVYVRGASMNDMGVLDPLLQRVLSTSVLAGVESQRAGLPPVAVEGKNPATGWAILYDSTYGFRLEIPEDWAWKELDANGPGLPEDWPVTRIVHLFPQAWEGALNRSGPPDPNAKIVVAPLSLEVCVGPDEAFRRVYPEPAKSEQTEIGGLQVTIEREVFEPMWVARYVFRDPDNPEVQVVWVDYFSGFPDRVGGNEPLLELLPRIVATFSFIR